MNKGLQILLIIVMCLVLTIFWALLVAVFGGAHNPVIKTAVSLIFAAILLCVHLMWFSKVIKDKAEWLKFGVYIPCIMILVQPVGFILACISYL